MLVWLVMYANSFLSCAVLGGCVSKCSLSSRGGACLWWPEEAGPRVSHDRPGRSFTHSHSEQGESSKHNAPTLKDISVDVGINQVIQLNIKWLELSFHDCYNLIFPLCLSSSEYSRKWHPRDDWSYESSNRDTTTAATANFLQSDVFTSSSVQWGTSLSLCRTGHFYTVYTY